MITSPAPTKASPVCMYDGKPYTAGAVRGDQICYWSQTDGFHEEAPFWQKRAAWQQ